MLRLLVGEGPGREGAGGEVLVAGGDPEGRTRTNVVEGGAGISLLGTMLGGRVGVRVGGRVGGGEKG